MTGLPDSWPEIRVHVCKEEKMQPGHTLVNFAHQKLQIPITAAVIDAHGETKWFYQHRSKKPFLGWYGDVADMRGDLDMRTVEEGVLVSGTNIFEGIGRAMAFVVSWDGELLWQNSMTNHHHVHRTPDGNYLFLTADRRHVQKYGKALLSDQIVEWDPRKNRVVWNWHLFDHHEPESDRSDYSHANTIEPDPRDDSLYLSCRNMNSILKIDKKTGEILWRLGENGGFAIRPEDRFYHQHAPELQPNGNLLLFDNGTGRPEADGGQYSRAIELELDEQNMRACCVWTWRPDSDLYCPIWGDADRLPNGNTLIVFGTRTEGETTRYLEVTHEGELVWDVEIVPSGWGTYRAERILREIPI